MSNTKPMKNTMRKQSPMKMKSVGEQAMGAVKAGVDKSFGALAKKAAEKKATTVKSKPTNFKEAVRKNAADRAAAKAAAATTKAKPATKAETPMPKPNRPAPKAATTKTPVMMKKMGKSSCGK
jgi:hypothetical protein